MPASAADSDSSACERGAYSDSDWEIDALAAVSSDDEATGRGRRSKSPLPRGLRSTKAAGRRLVSGTPSERAGETGTQRERAARGETDSAGGGGPAPPTEVGGSSGDGGVGGGRGLIADPDDGDAADCDNDGYESGPGGSLRDEDEDLEINGFAAGFVRADHGFAADAEVSSAGAAMVASRSDPWKSIFEYFEYPYLRFQ